MTDDVAARAVPAQFDTKERCDIWEGAIDFKLVEPRCEENA